MIVEELKQQVSKALHSLGVRNPEVQFEHPAELSHGDYSTNAALVYAKQLKVKPRELAEKILTRLNLSADLRLSLEKTEVAGAGFINFYLSKEFFAEAVKKIVQSSSRSDLFPDLRSDLKGKKIMVEYTDPNPFKEFHIGHLMSNAVGESIARIFEYHGAKVLRACWQGDVGLHVAKAIYALLQMGNDPLTDRKLGSAYVFGEQAYETHKREIDEINKKIYQGGDPKVDALYHVGREISLERFKIFYELLGTKFDYYFFEGKEGREGQPIVEKNIGSVFEKSEGAIVYRGEKHGLHTRVFLTKEGLPTYEAKELGLNKAKFEKEPDIDTSIIVTANEQSDYFKVVLAAMTEVLPEIAKRTKHLAHGMLRFSGGKMSSRKGNVITGETLIAQVIIMVHEKLKDRDMSEEEKKHIAETVAVGAIKYSILRQAIGGDIIFDFAKSISFEGDSGPYLQYSYVRAKSVLQKAERDGHPMLQVPNIGCSEGGQPTPTSGVGLLERLLPRFPEVVEHAGAELEPHYIATFLIELAGSFNSWYAKEQIVDANDPSSPYKVALTSAFATTMKNGLWLLGIRVPERM